MDEALALQDVDDPRDLMVVEEDSTLQYWADVGRPQQDPATGQLMPADEAKQKEFCTHVKNKQRDYFDAARARGLLRMWLVAYAAHHGLDPESMSVMQTQELGIDGEEGEFLRLCINIVRTYITRQSTQVLAQQPALKCKSSNQDAASQIGAKLGDDIVNSIFKRSMKGQKLRDAVITALVSGASFGHLRWDPAGGDMVDVDEPVIAPDGSQVVDQSTGTPAVQKLRVRSGAPRVSIGYPWTTFHEPEEQDQLMWRGSRVLDNKHNLVATYANTPDKLELRRKIMAADTADEYDFATLFGQADVTNVNKDACITIHWYHARCAAMPEGRYVIILGDLILWDGPCPVSEGVPIVEMCPARFMMKAFGYAGSWDLLSIQQAQNQVVSDVLSNIATFGRQSVAMEKGTEIVVDDLAKGHRGFFYPQQGKPPQAVLFNEVGKSPFDFLSFCEHMLDAVSGSNAAARGDPDANVKSGQFAALLHTSAAEYMVYLQESVDEFAEVIANDEIDMVRQYGQTPFVAECVGINNRTYVQEFTKDDVAGFHGVEVETVSPMLRNLAGRMDMHDKLKDYAPEDRSAAFAFIETGRSDEWMRSDRNSALYIQRENERLIKGDKIVAVNEFDDPFKHVPKHWAEEQAILASDNPDPEALARLHQHNLEHAIAYGKMHPFIAGFLKIPPPPPQLGTPAFDFAASCAQAQMLLGGGMGGKQQPANDQQSNEPQPGEAGSGRPRTSGKDAAGGPGGDNSAGAALPGGSGVDTSGVQLPEPAQPPPEMQENA